MANEIETLLQQLHEELSSLLYERAVITCEEIELAAEERAGFDNVPLTSVVPRADEFYAAYLLSLLVCLDLDEAKHLWKRSPDAVKHPETLFAQLWAVGKALFTGDFPAGVIAATSLAAQQTTTRSSLGAHLRLLQRALLSALLTRLSELYTSLPVSLAASVLKISEEALLEEARQVDWSIDAQGLLRAPSSSAGSLGNRQQERDLQIVQENVRMMETTAKLVAFLAKQPLRVDLSSKKETHSPVPPYGSSLATILSSR